MDGTAQVKKFLRFYQQSEVVFEEGSIGNEMYIVRTGHVKLLRNTGGEQVEIASIGRKQFFGEMALVDNCPRSTQACAGEDNTQLVALDKDKFLYMVSHHPAFAYTIMRVLCERIRGMNERLSRTA